mgnify:CR=1 FL=1
MAARWGLPLLGVVPDLPFLSKCSLGDMCKLLNAENRQDVVRYRAAVEDKVALANDVTLIDRKRAAFRQQIFDRLAVTLNRSHLDPALGLVVIAELDTAV